MATIDRAIASSFFILFIVALPYFTNTFHSELEVIRDALIYQETRYSVNTSRRAAVGFGSCLDMVTNGVLLLDRAGISPPLSPQHFDVVSSPDELAQVFAYFFENGAAAERYSDNKEFFDKLVSTAASDVNSSHWVLGGNAPVMSQRLAMEGWDVLLGARLSPATLKTLHPSVQLSINSSSDIKEDVHLIMEYDLNAEWGRYKSPRANRFILHNDYSNMMLQSMDGFVDKMVEFKPHLIIISGLQMLDNFRYNHSIRTMKLKVISDMLVSTPSDVKIHFEMASFTEDKLLKELLEYIIPYTDSIGMNEQELANLHNLLVYKSVNLVSDYSPRIATALDMARNVSKILRNNRPTNSRLLTRIHVHTLAYQAIFTEMGSGWVHTRSATAKASLMANRHVCSSQTINVENAKLIMDDSFSVSVLPNSQRIPLIEESPVSCWGEENFKICVAPNLVCTAIHKTASAGDNISAAGLSIQL